MIDVKELENRIINADCMDILKQLPDKCIDLVLTDPPYRVISGGRGDEISRLKWVSPVGILSKNDGKIFKHNDIDFSEWVPEVYRVLKDNSDFYVMTNTMNIFKLNDACQKAGFKIHNILVWEKNNATPNRWYMKNCEYTLYYYKGNAKSINNMNSKTVHKFINPPNNEHPTQKPIELMELYVGNSSDENDIVLDCFSGSGTTAIACHRLKRRFICIEKDKDYYEASVKRLEYEQRQGVLF